MKLGQSLERIKVPGSGTGRTNHTVHGGQIINLSYKEVGSAFVGA